MFGRKRYTVTDQEIQFLIKLGELKGGIDAVLNERDRLVKENTELRTQLADSNARNGGA